MISHNYGGEVGRGERREERKTWVERGVGKLKMGEEREIRRHKLTYFKKKKKKNLKMNKNLNPIKIYAPKCKEAFL
jgi:hypothetical protein